MYRTGRSFQHSDLGALLQCKGSLMGISLKPFVWLLREIWTTKSFDPSETSKCVVSVIQNCTSEQQSWIRQQDTTLGQRPLWTETPCTETYLDRDPLDKYPPVQRPPGQRPPGQRPPRQTPLVGTWDQAAKQEVTSYKDPLPSLWTEWLTHTCENIILPQTSFAGSNNRNCAKVLKLVVARIHPD